MVVAVILLSLLNVATVVLLVRSVQLNLKHSDKLQEVSDQIDESLDVLDACYQRAASRAELEVMSDEPVVRELVSDLKIAKDTILLVANLIVEPLKEDNLKDTE